jgi:DNA-binding SARP family transcriptional activator
MAVSDVLIQTIEELKESKKYQEALDYTNTLMNQDPTDERLLLQIADIQYRS